MPLPPASPSPAEPLPSDRPPSGAAMDRPLPPRGLPARTAGWVALALLLAATAAAVLTLRPAALTPVPAAQLATVQRGLFRDELALRARVEPLRSVQIDAPDAAVVQAVLVADGALVAAGTPLLRLHSPEQDQVLMQRSAEVAQQMANVSVQRSAQAATLAQHRRERAQLQAGLAQAEADHQRLAQLAAAGFMAPAALDQAQRQAELAAQLLAQAQADHRQQADILAQSLAEMDRAVAGLQRGLQLLEASRQRQLQRAPIAGRVRGLQLHEGASVRPGDHLARIDDPAGGLQLVAEVDEYYLPRLQPGLAAVPAHLAPLQLAQVLPQVQGGKVRVLLRWPAGPVPAGLQPGQAVDLHLQLAAPQPALLLPDGPGVHTPLYVRDGAVLHRRHVQLGRRAGGQVEVLAGLQAGDTVLISQPPTSAERLALP